MSKKKPGLRIEMLDVVSVRSDEGNVRTHSPENLAAIKASLTRFGQQKPIVVDADGVVRAGNGTLAAAKALGWTKIAAVRTDLAGAEATIYAVTDNRTSELADWDWPVLANVLTTIRREGVPIEATGWTESDFPDLDPTEFAPLPAGVGAPGGVSIADTSGRFILIYKNEEEARVWFARLRASVRKGTYTAAEVIRAAKESE